MERGTFKIKKNLKIRVTSLLIPDLGANLSSGITLGAERTSDGSNICIVQI